MAYVFNINDGLFEGFLVFQSEEFACIFGLGFEWKHSQIALETTDCNGRYFKDASER